MYLVYPPATSFDPSALLANPRQSPVPAGPLVAKEVAIDAADPFTFVAVIVTEYEVPIVNPVHVTDPDPKVPGDPIYDPAFGDIAYV